MKKIRKTNDKITRKAYIRTINYIPNHVSFISSVPVVENEATSSVAISGDKVGTVPELAVSYTHLDVYKRQLLGCMYY